MAEGTNGEGRKAADRRYHGAGDNNLGKVDKKKNDQRGDLRHLKKKPTTPSSGKGSVVPIAATIGGDLPKADNGGGKRIAPASMIKAGL